MVAHYQSRAGTSKGPEAAAYMGDLYGLGRDTQKATQEPQNGYPSTSCAVERPAKTRVLQRSAAPPPLEEIECESRAGTSIRCARVSGA